MVSSHLIIFPAKDVSLKRVCLTCLIIVLPLFFCRMPAADTKTLTLAIEDADFYPWTMRDLSGVDLGVIRKAAVNAHISIKIVALPWKRCLASLRENRIDGVFPVSYKDSRVVFGGYPVHQDGTVDESKRLHTGSYSLYVRRDSSLDWDGIHLMHRTGLIGAPSGYSIIDDLNKKGVEVHEVPSPEKLMKMLVMGRIQGGATSTAQGNYILRKDHELSAKVKVLIPPLAVKPYYLMFSHKLIQENKELADTLWREIQNVRNSGGYQKMYNEYLNQ